MGYLKILIGILIFSGTVPMSKLALNDFTSFEIATFRVAIGGALALLYLISVRKLPLIRKHFWDGAPMVIGLGGFPFLIAHALEGLPATFSAVGLGVLPLATSLIAILFFREKVSRDFYPFALLGAGIAIAYSLDSRAESLYHVGILGLAIFSAGTGYAYGARLARKVGGALSISIAMAIMFPLGLIGLFSIPSPAALLAESGSVGILALLYLAILSQYIGHFPFYSGLAQTGTAKGIQLQLLQPFLTLFLSALLLSEQLYLSDLLTLAALLSTIALANRPADIGKLSRLRSFSRVISTSSVE